MHWRGVGKAPTFKASQRASRCVLEALESRCLFSTSLFAQPAVENASILSQPIGYRPSQVLHAYGFDTAAANIGAVGGDGSGETIAIVEAFHSPTLASDLLVFDKHFGLAPPPSLTQINQSGANTPPASDILWSQETSLDVEWAHAVAPKANIVVVEADSADIRDLVTAVDTARHLPEVSVISMSWGVSEFPTEAAYDGIFTTPRGHQNVTFVASSGDTASSKQVQWPAVSPNVVSVGGTTLTVSKTDGGASETSYAGAVAGLSQYESKPGYQNGVNTSAMRSIPDVVYDANPKPGFAVYNSDSAGWQTLGGTSSGAPQWAALLAIANQVRSSSGLSTLNGRTQTLPALYTYYKKNHSATITTPSSTPGLTAGALLSNSGKPQATGVITALLNPSTPTSKSSASASAPQGDATTQLPISQLPRRRAHPLFLNVTAAPPVSRLPAPLPLMRADVGKLIQLPSLLADSTAGLGGFVPLRGGFGPARSSATRMLAIALPEMLTVAATSSVRSDSIAQLMNALYGDIPALGLGSVSPVGLDSTDDATIADRTWYIAHVNVAATFADAMSAFVSDCAAMTPMRGSALAGPRSHVRAWTITAGMAALDAVLLYYAAPRRRRRFNAHGRAFWL